MNKSRIRILEDVFLAEGEDAARAKNASFAATHPKGSLSEATLSTQFSHFRQKAQRSTSQPSRPERTAALEAAGMRLTGAKRLPDSKARLYRLEDGRIVKMTTNIRRSLMDHDDGLFKHPFDALLIVMPLERDTLSNGVEAYLVPTDVAKAAFKTGWAAWEATNPRTSGNNKTPVLYFDEVGSVPAGMNYKTTWSQYRVPGTDYPTGDVSALQEEAPEPAIRSVSFPRYRGLFDGELLSASTAEGFVTLMRNNTYSHWTPTSSNTEYMQALAERGVQYSGGARKVRIDTAEHFLEDLSEAGVIEWLKRELVLEDKAA